MDSILTNVDMEGVARDTFKLSTAEKVRIDMQLTKTMKYVRGESIEEMEKEQQTALAAAAKEKENDASEGQWLVLLLD